MGVKKVFKSDFGDCCSDLRDAMSYVGLMDKKGFLNSVPSSTFSISDDGTLFVSTGYMEEKNGGIGWFDMAVMYCPFCGAKLQQER